MTRSSTCAIAALAAACALCGAPASATTTMNGQWAVTRVFAETPDRGGFYSDTGFSMCLHDVMFFDLSTEYGKAQFSMILTAKPTGAFILRIDYDLDGAGRCWVAGLHMA